MVSTSHFLVEVELPGAAWSLGSAVPLVCRNVPFKNVCLPGKCGRKPILPLRLQFSRPPSGRRAEEPTPWTLTRYFFRSNGDGGCARVVSFLNPFARIVFCRAARTSLWRQKSPGERSYDPLPLAGKGLLSPVSLGTTQSQQGDARQVGGAVQGRESGQLILPEIINMKGISPHG